MKHIAHTFTLNPRHTMNGKTWRLLCQECYTIVFHNAEDTKPAFTKTVMKRWLAKIYKLYAYAPDHMTMGYTANAVEYWGLVDIDKFAKATHFEPTENVVKILKVMAAGSTSTYNQPKETEPKDEGSRETMLFPLFAKTLVKLCCLSTVDLVAFFVFVVNEDVPKAEEVKLTTSQATGEETKDVQDAPEVAFEEADKEKEDEEEDTLGVTQRRLEKLLCQIHRGHGNAEDLSEADFIEGPSGYSWAIDLEDMSGIILRSLKDLRTLGLENGQTLGPSDLLKLLLRCPIFSYPCMYMQRCLRRRIFGEHFWLSFDMCHHRPGLPLELSQLSKSVESKGYHIMTLRHAWAETTRYILLDALGVSPFAMDADQSETHHEVSSVFHEPQHTRCCVQDCKNKVDPKEEGLALCQACALKSVGVVADSVGIRVASRFRERTRWFSAKKGAEGLPVHNKWLLMRDRLTRSNFYFNGETAATRWVLNQRQKNVEITDVRPKKKKKKKKRRKSNRK
jgi:hypothetical protein